ncbi:hypothetical protein [Tenacibaculum sp. 190524A02b]|uniref:Uncharacterized protein n=1 Tax=Tenacibaculum vairaonense TaxID=3137860 RepID=A0ABP1F8B1_9FLAO
MPKYYVQNFTYDGPGDSLCYGEMGAHNHDQSNQFTIDVKAYLTSQGATHIREGHFQSNQNKPANGKLFKWKDNKWVKA